MDTVLDIQDVTQLMNVENVGKKIKSMIVDQTIEDVGDKIILTFTLDKQKGNENE